MHLAEGVPDCRPACFGTDFPEPYLSFMAGLDTNGNGLICESNSPKAAADALDPEFGLPVGSPLYKVGDDSVARG